MTTRYRSFMPQLCYDIKCLFLPLLIWVLILIGNIASLSGGIHNYVWNIIHEPVGDIYRIYLSPFLRSDALSICVFAMLLALYQQFLTLRPKRARYFEALPTTCAQRHVSKLLAAGIVLVVPVLFATGYAAVHFSGVLSIGKEYAIASPFMEAISYQMNIWIIVIQFLRYGLIALSAYAFALAMTSFFGNAFAGTGYLFLGFFVGISFLLASNSNSYGYHGALYNLRESISSFVYQKFLAYPPYTAYLPWDDFLLFTLIHIVFTGVFGGISLRLAKTAKPEKIGDTLLNKASRYAILVLAIVAAAAYLMASPVGYLDFNYALPYYLVAFVPLALLIYGLFGKGFKKLKNLRFFSVLVMILLLGGAPHAKADDMLRNAYPMMDPTAIAVEEALVSRQEAFLSDVEKMILSVGTFSFDYSYSSFYTPSVLDPVAYSTPEPLMEAPMENAAIDADLPQPTPMPRRELSYEDVLFYQNSVFHATYNPANTTDPVWAKWIELLQAHGYNKTAVALKAGMDYYTAQNLDPWNEHLWEPYPLFFEEDIGFELGTAYYYGYQDGETPLKMTLYLKFPLMLKEAQAIEDALEMVPRLIKTNAFHNTETGYLQYRFLGDHYLYAGNECFSIIEKEGHILRITIDTVWRDNNAIAANALAALLADAPDALEKAQGWLTQNTTAKAQATLDGYLVKCESPEGYNTRRITITAVE